MRRLILFATLYLWATNAQSQTCLEKISDLPYPNSSPTYFSNYYAIRRPSLSFNGFDCNSTGCNKGNGIKQALENVFGSQASFATRPNPREMYFNIRQRLPFSTIADIGATLSPNEHREGTDINAGIIEAAGLYALMSLLWERQNMNANGFSEGEFDSCQIEIGVQGLPATSYADMQSKFVGLLRRISNSNDNTARAWFDFTMADGGVADVDKRRFGMLSMARALDMYFAYKNAVQYTNPTRLLSSSEEDALMTWWVEQIDDADETHYQAGGTYDRFLVEVGNWSAIAKSITGYSSLAFQPISTSTLCDSKCIAAKYYIDRAATAMICPSETSNGTLDQWNFDYTSAGGKRTWAEGPYYLHYAQTPLFHLWHALRTNDLTGVSHGCGSHDPFRESRFTNPFDWLADLATPYGETPPFDDGNRNRLYAGILGAWSSDYGDPSVGQKYAWISRQVFAFGGAESKVYMQALALPPATGYMPPIEMYGPGAYPWKPAEQAIIRTVPTSQDPGHYVAVNNEGLVSEQSISRGHGHEQPDNMNLVYYVGGASAIMDAGYDRGDANDGSTWNDYYYQNTLRIRKEDINECPGLQAFDAGDIPINSLFDPPPSWHFPATSLSVKQEGQVRLISASQRLNVDVSTYCNNYKVSYNRNTIVVGPFEYLIDLNSGARENGASNAPMAVGYRFDTSTIEGGTYGWALPYDPTVNGYINAGGSEQWITSGPLRWVPSNQAPSPSWRTYIFPMGVEHSYWAGYGDTGLRLTTNYFTQERAAGADGATGGQQTSQLMLYSNGNTATHTVATIIKASQTAPSQTPQEFAVGGARGFIWQPSGTDYDVFISRPASDPGTSDILFNVSAAGSGMPSAEFLLPSGTAFGFIRFTIQNGIPVATQDYRLNLIPVDVVSQSTSLYTDPNWGPAKAIRLANDVALTLWANTTITPGARIFLGDRARIITFGTTTISSSGSATVFKLGLDAAIDAYGSVYATGNTTYPIRFERFNANDRWKALSLLGNTNQLSRVIFDGGQKNLEIRSSGNVLSHIESRNGINGLSTGLSVSGYRPQFELSNSLIEYSSGAGVFASGTDVTDFRSNTIRNNGKEGVLFYGSVDAFGFRFNTITGNGTQTGVQPADYHLGSGLRVGAYSHVDAWHVPGGWNRIYSNAGHEVTVNYIGKVWLGFNTNTSTYNDGHNAIFDLSHNEYDSEKLVYADSSISFKGYEDYWGGGNPPPSGYFQGLYQQIDIGSALQDDPGPYAYAGSSGVMASRASVEPVLSLQAAPTQGPILPREPRTQERWFRERVLMLRRLISESPRDPIASSWIMELAGLMHIDRADAIGERARNLALLQGEASLLENPKLNAASTQAAETAALVLLYEALMQESYVEGEQLVHRFKNRMRSTPAKQALFMAQADLFERKGDYQSAVSSLEMALSFAPARGDVARRDDMVERQLEMLRERMSEESVRARMRPPARDGLMQSAPAPVTSRLAVRVAPNPFASQTVLRLTVPQACRLRVEIFDVLGRQISVLVDEQVPAGAREVLFNAQALPGGVYVYRVTGGTEVVTGSLTRY